MSFGPKTPVLREYQATTVRDTSAALKKHRRVLLQSPTGSGKSVMIAHMLRTASVERGMTCWLVCHRRELLKQLSDDLWASGVEHGMIAAGRSGSKAPVQVASIQTLARRLDRLPPPDLLAIDEAHHATAASYRRIIEHCSKSWTIGLTATPERTDGTGLGDLFNAMVHGPTVKELTGLGYLSPYRIIAPDRPLDMSGIHSRGGDYVKSEAAARAQEVTGKAVEHYMEYVHPHTCLVYCVTRAHARFVTENYLAAGIDAAYVAGDTPAAERERLVAGFKNGHPKVVVSVDLFGEGLDAPGLQAVQLLRPTKSLILHLQQIGRALRIEEGKDSAIILDHVGNSWIHGLPDDDREWSLAGRDKKPSQDQAIGLRHCPDCFAIYRATLLRCPGCGHEHVPEPVVLEESDEKLVEFDSEQHKAMRAQEKKREESDCRTLEDLVLLGMAREYSPSWAGVRWSFRHASRVGGRAINRQEGIRQARAVMQELGV